MQKELGLSFAIVIIALLTIPCSSFAEQIDVESPAITYESIVSDIAEVIGRKTDAISGIAATVDDQNTVCDSLDQMLETGDFGGLAKGDIVKAGQKVHSAMQHGVQAQDALRKSIACLEEAMRALGWQLDGLPAPGSTLSDSTPDLWEDCILQIARTISQNGQQIIKLQDLIGIEEDICAALDQILASGDLGELKKGDIVKAGQKIFSAIQHQEQCGHALTKSIEKLQDALAALGWELPPLPQAVSYWAMDEGEGTDVYDSVGTNDGTIHRADWTGGIAGAGLYFDRGRRYVRISDTDDSLDVYEGEDFSVSLWFRIAGRGSAGANLLNKRQNEGDCRGYGIWYENRSSNPDYHKLKALLALGDSHALVTSATNVDDDAWHHMVFMRQGNAVRLYIDGVMEDEWAQAGFDADISNSNPLIMGSFHTLAHHHYHGLLDEVAFYPTALTDAEVLANYLAPFIGP